MKARNRNLPHIAHIHHQYDPRQHAVLVKPGPLYKGITPIVGFLCKVVVLTIGGSGPGILGVGVISFYPVVEILVEEYLAAVCFLISVICANLEEQSRSFHLRVAVLL